MDCIACNTPLPDGAAFCPLCGRAQPEAPQYDRYEYAAFISYRHRPLDEKAAKLVQRAVESYRLPQGIPSPSGTRKLGRVFRDQDELPAVNSLPEAIDQALKRSRMLIVVCTPSTKDSIWVQREIEAFAAYHGRDRIIAVVADGTTKQSLPETLASRTVVQEDGARESRPAEPLAADFRSRSRTRLRAEKLRVIAAIAGCSFEELARRDRTQRIKRGALAAVLAAAVALVIAFLAVNLHEAEVERNLAESRNFATASLEASADGRHFDAQRLALQAIDAAKRAGSSFLVPKAQLALEEASGLYLSIDEPWLPCDSRKLEGSPDTFAIYHSDLFYLTVDGDLQVNVYSPFVQDPIYTRTIPARGTSAMDSIPSSWRLALRGNFLLAWSPSLESSGYFYCFDLLSDDNPWTLPFIYLQDIAFVPNSDTGLFCGRYPESDKLYYGIMKLSNRMASYHPDGISLFDGQDSDAPLHIRTEGFHSAFGQGSTIAAVDFEEREIYSAQAPIGQVSSLRWCDGTLVVASCETREDGRSKTFDYHVSAYTKSLEPIWDNGGTFAVDAEGSSKSYRFADALPRLAAYPGAGSSLLLAAGTSVFELNVQTGEQTEVFRASAPIISLDDGDGKDDNDDITISCVIDSHGTATPLVHNEEGFSAQSNYQLHLPSACNEAYSRVSDLYGLQVMAFSASEPDRYYAYRLVVDGTLPNMQSSNELRVEGDYEKYEPTADCAHLIGSRSDSHAGTWGVFDGRTLELLQTIDAKAIMGDEYVEGGPFSFFLSKAHPDLLYFMQYEDDGKLGGSSLYAYDLNELKLASKSARSVDTMVAELEESTDVRSSALLRQSTRYGMNLVRITSDGNSLVTMSPETLEEEREVPIGYGSAPLQAWPLEDRMLVAWTKPSYPRDGFHTVELIASSDGAHIVSDIDSHEPYDALAGENACLVLSDDAEKLAIACNDNQLRCFDLPSGTLRWSVAFSGRLSRHLEFDSSGNWLLAQDENGFCTFVDVRSGRTAGTTSEALPAVESGRFSLNGERFYAVCQGDDDLVPTTYVLSNVDGDIGIASILGGVSFITPNNLGLLRFESRTEAIGIPYFTIDEAYETVKRILEYHPQAPTTDDLRGSESSGDVGDGSDGSPEAGDADAEEASEDAAHEPESSRSSSVPTKLGYGLNP